MSQLQQIEAPVSTSDDITVDAKSSFIKIIHTFEVADPKEFETRLLELSLSDGKESATRWTEWDKEDLGKFVGHFNPHVREYWSNVAADRASAPHCRLFTLAIGAGESQQDNKGIHLWLSTRAATEGKNEKKAAKNEDEKEKKEWGPLLDLGQRSKLAANLEEKQRQLAETRSAIRLIEKQLAERVAPARPKPSEYDAALAETRGRKKDLQKDVSDLLEQLPPKLYFSRKSFELILHRCDCFVIDTGTCFVAVEFRLARTASPEPIEAGFPWWRTQPPTMADYSDVAFLLRGQMCNDRKIRFWRTAKLTSTTSPYLPWSAERRAGWGEEEKMARGRIKLPDYEQLPGVTLVDGLKTLLGDDHEADRGISLFNERLAREAIYVRLPREEFERIERENLHNIDRGFARLLRTENRDYTPPAEPRYVGASALNIAPRVWLDARLEAMVELHGDSGSSFDDERGDRFRHPYFAHYLLVLHQRTMLRRLARDVARLPGIGGVRDADVGPDALSKAQKVRNDVIEFNLRHRFSNVSTTSNYAEIYERLIRALRLDALRDEIRDEVGELETWLSTLFRTQEDKRRQQFTKVVAVVGITLAYTQIFNTPIVGAAAFLGSKAPWVLRIPCAERVPCGFGVSLLYWFVGLAGTVLGAWFSRPLFFWFRRRLR